MKDSKKSENGSGILLKHTIADRLRSEIVKGACRPGEKIVEGVWARAFGVSQASIREAINILVKEGFVTKVQGRSARVVNLSADDVMQIYQMRGVMEGLAARLAAEKGRDTRGIEEAMRIMVSASKEDKLTVLLDANLQFHLGLFELSGNSYLIAEAHRLLKPFFAFVRIRAIASGQSASLWSKDFPAYSRIIELVKEGEGEIAEEYVRKVMVRIAATAYESWERKPSARQQE
jgi:DNA-binding GntR family transcriptional regulator